MLRKRKNRRYNETHDEEVDGERKFNIIEQVKSTRFDRVKEKHLQELPGDAITLRFIQKNGFEKPVLVTKPDGLDLRVPLKSFLVRDVRNYVGHHRIIDVMDVKTQKNIEMSMKDWCKYYESKNRDKLLNVISLEFSHTRLDELVEAPMIVRLLDWVDLVWPKFLKLSQIESTNTIDKMKYPKVQKYCLMSVKGSYTDFHIDFGGTSVWYHILRGKKIFWMVPPTELNLQTFEEWTLSGMQQDVFFGDTVEECFRVELCAGNTFFIPSGWIHAVYTLEDSLVFGGNFLHSFGIENQLKVSKIEDSTKVPVKFRYPFYTEILWYVVQHYVHCLLDKDHLHRPDYEAAELAAIEAAAIAAKEIENAKAIEDETTESEHEESDTPTTKTTKGNKRKAPANSKRKRRGKPQRSAPKRTKKAPPPPPSSSDEEEDDDESTDIDSANEELNKPPEKPTINTCRMTKNSLLRLQYEIDEKQQLAKAIASSLSSSSPTKSKPQPDNGSKTGDTSGSSSKSPAASKKKKQQQQQAATKSSTSPPPEKPKSANKSNHLETPTPATTTISNNNNSNNNNLNLADMVLSHETKLNGWSSGGSAVGSQSIWSNPNHKTTDEPTKINITKLEVNGLKLLVKHLSKLSGAKKNLPSLIRNSRALLDDCKKLIAEHENDDPELAITGKPITRELLKPKTSDMNELIGQFFKHTADKADNDEHQGQQSSSSPVKGNSSPMKSIKSDPASSSSSPAQQRLKHGSTSNSSNNNHINSETGSRKGDEKKATGDGSSSSSISNNNNNISSATFSCANESTATKLSSTNHKETKCLSPNKKLSSAAGATSASSTSAASSSSSSTPPPRIKSPPTRPLSMNQYTSKTKKETNLLLPGSFADLIAATSTEKKVFDVSGADVASSLFGMGKDLASSTSSSPTKTCPSKTSASQKDRSRQRSVSNSSSGSGSSIKMRDAGGATAAAAAVIGQPSSSNSAPTNDIPMATGSSTGTTRDHLHQPNKLPNSPEPPKVSPNFQKRFVAPNVRPANKEKLIYASAPYISPVHASEASRSTNQYPWQMPIQQGSTYSPLVGAPQQPPPTRPQSHSSAPPTPQQQQQHLLSGAPSVTPAPYTPDTRGFTAQGVHHLAATTAAAAPVGHGRDSEQRVKQQHQPTLVVNREQAEQPGGDKDNIVVKINQNDQQHALSAPKEIVGVSDNHSKPSPLHHQSPIVPQAATATSYSGAKLAQAAQSATGGGKATPEPNKQQSSTTGDSDQVAKKPTKPRGPPKKSKEARQVIESGPVESVISPALTTVIRAGPAAATAAATVGTSSNIVVPAVQSNIIPPQPPPPTPQTKTTKGKRLKKQKDSDSNRAGVPAAQFTSAPQAIQPQPLLTTMTPNQVRPSVICGLVRPMVTQSQQHQHQPPTTSVVTTGSKINPQSYIISRPLFSFNSMPTFTAAQFQQMQQQQQQQQHHNHQQRPLNLLTTPMSSPLGLPTLQQGARLVWATQPRKMAPIGAATNLPPPGTPLMSAPSAGAGAARPPIAHVSSQSDNAALLSLATTALSTAPMPTLPALSHLSNRAPAPQAIMMSSAATSMASQQQQQQQQQAALFAAAGQQFFRPYVPLTHLISRPGAPRQSGQLVFARLPPANQGQPRYLITQPGYMQQRLQAPHIVTNQPTSTLAFATYKPPPEPPKAMKTKKVKTS